MMNSGRQHQQGQALLLMVVLLGVLLFFAALAVDVGVLYTARTSAQHIADASALAGAYTFLDSRLTPTSQPAAAQNAALAAARDPSNSPRTIMGNSVTVTVADSDVTLTPQQTVTTTATVSVPVFFAKVFRSAPVSIKAVATAEAATVAGGTGCLKPFWILNSNGQHDPKTGACTKPLLSGGVPTNNWTLPIDIMVYGNSSPSNYELVNPNSYDGSMAGSCTGGGGAVDVATAIGSCVPASCGGTMCKSNGGKVGPTLKAISDLVGSSPDKFVDIGQYENPTSGVISDTSRSLVTAVIWDDCGKCKPDSGYSNCGKTGFPVAGFGQMFITTVGGKQVTAKLVKFAGCGADNQGSGGTGPYAIPVRLVNKAN